MKKQIQAMFIALAVLLVTSLLVSLILTVLFFFQVFLTSTIEIIRLICSFVVFIIAGFVLGRLIKERTFFFALVLAIVGVGLSIFFNHSLLFVLIGVLKWLLFTISSLIAKSI